MMMTMMRRSVRPMMTSHRPVRRTPTRQLEGIPALVGALSRTLLKSRPQPPVQQTLARNTLQGEFGPAAGPLRLPAGERCFPGGPGRRQQQLSPPAVRAVHPAAASPHVWSYHHPFTAYPQGQRFPRPAGMSHCPLREDHLLSDPFPPFALFPPAATGHPRQEPLLHHSGYSTGPLDTFHGRAHIQRAVMCIR